MELSWHDTVSLLALPVDERPGDLDVLLLFLDALILRVFKRDVQLVFIIAGTLFVGLLLHEGSLNVSFSHFLLAKDTLGHCSVGVDEFVLAV